MTSTRDIIINAPDDPALDELCQALAARANDLDVSGDWPAEQLDLCARAGVYQWFVPHKLGGQGWSEVDLIRGYLRLSAACMTTTFIITQFTGALRRIIESENDVSRSKLLASLVNGSRFATVGISHLTTSRRHIGKPALQATPTADGFVLDGFSPWVTGARHADSIVIGATLDDGRQILVALPTELPGVTVPPPLRLVALSASHTGPVQCERVEVGRELLLNGPEENVIAGAAGAKTGGLQTSTLAVGLARAAIDYLTAEAEKRPDLLAPLSGLRAEHLQVQADLLAVAAGEPVCTSEDLRIRCNSLVLRATQAALAAAKGTGFVATHPCGRWCREALFFLVWSCPQPVMAANLCEFAGLHS